MTEKPFRTAGARRNSKDKTKTQNPPRFLESPREGCTESAPSICFFSLQFSDSDADSSRLRSVGRATESVGTGERCTLDPVLVNNASNFRLGDGSARQRNQTNQVGSCTFPSRTQSLPENGAVLGDLSCPDQRTTEGGHRSIAYELAILFRHVFSIRAVVSLI